MVFTLATISHPSCARRMDFFDIPVYRILNRCYNNELYNTSNTKDLQQMCSKSGRRCGTRKEVVSQENFPRECCELRNETDSFQFKMDVKEFKPEEITVKIVGNVLVVHGKHEEKRDQNGTYISREFTRRCDLPEEVETERVISSLTHDGILMVEAPKKQIEPPKTNERIIPITRETVESRPLSSAVDQTVTIESDSEDE